MTDLPGGLLSGAGALVGGVLGGASDLVGGATQVVAQAGDTLGSIADAHGVPLSSVVEANPQVLHPDLVQPGQAISVPQPGPASAAETPPAEAAPSGGLVDGLGQTVAQTATAAGGALGQAVGGSPATAPQDAAPPSAAPQAAVTVTIGQGSADFRVLAQAAPPLAPTLAATPGSPTLMQALAGIDPALAQLLAAALASPTLSTPATAAQLAKLETALLSLGWGAVTLGLAKPGDVVLVLRAALLQAARIPAEGLALEAAAPGEHPAGAPLPRALGPPSATPPGIDAAGPQRLRGRSPGAEADEASKAGPDGKRAPAESPQRAWIARALPTAFAVKARWGVPVAVTIAQGALASDWGRAAPGNDYFGVGERAAELPRLAAPEARVPVLRRAAPVAFEGVDDAAGAAPRGLRRAPRAPSGGVNDAAEAFGSFVGGTPVFARAFRAPDAKTFARRLGEAGFSRDAAHGERLAELIDAYDLNALDG